MGFQLSKGKCGCSSTDMTSSDMIEHNGTVGWAQLRALPEAGRESLLLSIAKDADFKAGRVAYRLRISPRQLQRHFRDWYDTTPHTWFKRLRLVEARQRLAGADSVKAVALDLGFRTAPQFSRDFKRECGMSPASLLGRRPEQLGRPSQARIALIVCPHCRGSGQHLVS